VIILILAFPLGVIAHPGRTDSKGGHYDRKTGTYHYHSKPGSSKSATESNSTEKPVKMNVKLFINEEQVQNAAVEIRENGRSYALLGPMAKAMGITDEIVTSNDDPVPVVAFLRSHNYDVEWLQKDSRTGLINATRKVQELLPESQPGGENRGDDKSEKQEQ